MVKEISPPQARYMTAPPSGINMSRIPIPSSSRKQARDKPPSSRPTSVQKPRTGRRSILGDRSDVENIPLQSSASRPKMFESKVHSPAKRRPVYVPRVIGSPASPSNMQVRRTPSAAARAMCNPVSSHARPSLSMSTMNLSVDPDATMLFDMQPPSFDGMSSPVFSEFGDQTPQAKSRSIMGPGRMMTPVDSQESDELTLLPANANSAHRLPTPPSSQNDDLSLPRTATISRIRPRPAPTPPRPSAMPSHATDVFDPSPNPRKKKSPRVQQPLPSPSRARSPQTSTLTGLSRLVGVNSQPAPSTPTTAVLQIIEQRVAPSTAPAASRKSRKSMPVAKRPAAKPRVRQSLPAPSRKARKSLTPAAIEKLTGIPVGLLDAPVEAEPGDDPLLLKGKDDDVWLAKRRMSRSQSLASSQLSGWGGSQREDPVFQRGPSRLREVLTLNELAHRSSPAQLSPSPALLATSPDCAREGFEAGQIRDSIGPTFGVDAEIGSPANMGEYDMSFDVAPGWASDDSSEAGDPEEQVKDSARTRAPMDPRADGTITAGDAGILEEAVGLELPITPVSKAVLSFSTTPLLSPPISSQAAVLTQTIIETTDIPHDELVQEARTEVPLTYDFSIDDIVSAVQNRSHEGDTTLEADPSHWDLPVEPPVSTTHVTSPTVLNIGLPEKTVPKSSPEEIGESPESDKSDHDEDEGQNPIQDTNAGLESHGEIAPSHDLPEFSEAVHASPSKSLDLDPEGLAEAGQESTPAAEYIPVSTVKDDKESQVSASGQVQEACASPATEDQDAARYPSTHEVAAGEVTGDVTEEAVSIDWDLSAELQQSQPELTDEDRLEATYPAERESFDINSHDHEVNATPEPNPQAEESSSKALGTFAADDPSVASPEQKPEIEQNALENESDNSSFGDDKSVTPPRTPSPGLSKENIIVARDASLEDEDNVNSFESDSTDIDAEADRVFERYISIPRSPMLVPIQTVAEGFEVSPIPTLGLTTPRTPASIKRPLHLTPRRHLGSPYRMVISPAPLRKPLLDHELTGDYSMQKAEVTGTDFCNMDVQGSQDNETTENSHGTAILDEVAKTSLAHGAWDSLVPDNVAPGELGFDAVSAQCVNELALDEEDKTSEIAESSMTGNNQPSAVPSISAPETEDRCVIMSQSLQDHKSSPVALDEQRESSLVRVEVQQASPNYDEHENERDGDDLSHPQDEVHSVVHEHSSEDRLVLAANSNPDQEDGHRFEAESEYEERPVRQSSRIVLRLVSRGTVKVERPSDPAEISAREEINTPFVESATESIAQSGEDSNNTPSIAGPSEQHPQLSDSEQDPLSSDVYPQPEAGNHSATGTMASSPLCDQPATAEADSLGRSAQHLPDVSHNDALFISDRPSQRQRSSSVASSHRLSGLSLIRNDQQDELEVAAEDTQGHEELQAERRRGRRSLSDELHDATADESFGAGNDSFRSVVEVSSLDPRAAARAAAILKMNHAYIEHGVLPSTPAADSIPLPTPSTPTFSASRTPRSARRARGYESKHFATIDSARKLNREELLYEAELEIVQSRRSRSRSRAKSLGLVSASGWESDETEYALPGGWKRTPGQKRKRARSLHFTTRPELDLPEKSIDEPRARKDGRPWGIAEWKKLEKVFRSEKEAWIKEREIKPLPGFFGWAKKALVGDKEVKEWDNERVVKRFLDQEGAHGLGGEWTEKLIGLRVKALEKRVNAARTNGPASSTEEVRKGKKQRTEEKRTELRERALSTPQKEDHAGDSTVVSIVPPSTIRRMLGYVWSRNAGETSVIEEEDAEVETPSRTLASDSQPGPEVSVKRVENKFLTRLKAVREPIAPTPSTASAPSVSAISASRDEQVTPMRQVIRTPIPEHPSSPSWRTPPIPGAFRSHFNAPGPANQSTPAVERSSSGVEQVGTEMRPAAPVTPKIYPSLNPPMSQRSSALKALFATPSGLGSKAVTIPPRKGRQSVSALVRSFEEEGTFARSYEKEKGRVNELRKVQSRGV